MRSRPASTSLRPASPALQPPPPAPPGGRRACAAGRGRRVASLRARGRSQPLDAASLSFNETLDSTDPINNPHHYTVELTAHNTQSHSYDLYIYDVDEQLVASNTASYAQKQLEIVPPAAPSPPPTTSPTGTFRLLVRKAGDGTGTVTSVPAGFDCDATCSFQVQDYPAGAIVGLDPRPDPGSTFAGWSGDPDCSDGILLMDDNRDCTATFTRVSTATFQLTVFKGGSGTGTVTSTPAGIDCDAGCVFQPAQYAAGTVLILTAAPGAGSVFAGWDGDADCSDGLLTIIADAVCTATFRLAATGGSSARPPSRGRSACW